MKQGHNSRKSPLTVDVNRQYQVCTLSTYHMHVYGGVLSTWISEAGISCLSMVMPSDSQAKEERFDTDI